MLKIHKVRNIFHKPHNLKDFGNFIFQYNNECWMMQQTCSNEKIVEIQSKGKCPHPSQSCNHKRNNEEICTCPPGADAPRYI